MPSLVRHRHLDEGDPFAKGHINIDDASVFRRGLTEFFGSQ